MSPALLDHSRTHADAAFNNVVTLRHMTPEDQEKTLKKNYATASHTIFLLRGGNREAYRQRLTEINLVCTDLDGTAATGSYMEPRALAAMRFLRDLGVTTIPVTGRPHDEVLPLYQNHNDDPGFSQAVGEAGAYLFEGERSAFLLSHPQVEEIASEARSRIMAVLSELAPAHNLTWKPMGFGGHKSCGAWQFERESRRIKDVELHKKLLEQVCERIPEITITSSSIGAIEIIVDPRISKAAGIRTLWERESYGATDTMIAGDSQNDSEMFAMAEDVLKVVVVNDHTPLELIKQAHIATVGSANLAPVLEHLTHIRRQILGM